MLKLISILSFIAAYSVNLKAQISDDFENASTINQWQIFESGDPAYYQSLMCNDSLIEGNTISDSQGKLVITCGNTYWYANVTGPYVYQMTWGDFTATTSVRAVDRDNTAVPPEYEYNSAGLVVRNPDASLGQNYIMTNLGMQSAANQVGSESKTTVNSNSTLYLDPDQHEGEVRIQRTGTMIRTYKRTAGDQDFVLLDEFDRPDIPDTVQIGMVLNGYENPPDIRGEFEYIHFSGGDCRIVRNGNDLGESSLRNAVACAHAGDTIRFDHVTLGDSILLSSGLLLIDKDLVILNAGTGQIPVDGTNLSVIIEIAEAAHVTLAGLHLITSDSTGQYVIQNHGTLSLIDCAFSGVASLESVVQNTGTLSINGTCLIK